MKCAEPTDETVFFVQVQVVIVLAHLQILFSASISSFWTENNIYISDIIICPDPRRFYLDDSLSVDFFQ